MIYVVCGPAGVAIEGADVLLINELASLFFWDVRHEHERVDIASQWLVSIRMEPPMGRRRQPERVAVEFNEVGLLHSERPRIIEMVSTEGWIVIDAANRRAEVHNTSARGLFIDTYRLVRQIIIHLLTTMNFSCLHASTVAHDGQAYAFIGQKGAGKTSLAAHLSACYGYDVVSNDKLFARGDGQAVHFPEAPAVTIQTLLSLPDTRSRLERAAQLSPKASELFLDHPPLPQYAELSTLPVEHKVFFSEKQFLALLTARGITVASLRCISLVDRNRSTTCAIQQMENVDLEPYRDTLDMFHDWIGLRGDCEPKPLDFNVPLIHIRPATTIEETAATVAAFLQGRMYN